jgi:hypothetical protein
MYVECYGNRKSHSALPINAFSASGKTYVPCQQPWSATMSAATAMTIDADEYHLAVILCMDGQGKNHAVYAIRAVLQIPETDITRTGLLRPLCDRLDNSSDHGDHTHSWTYIGANDAKVLAARLAIQ